MELNHFCKFIDNRVVTSSPTVAQALADEVPGASVYLTSGPTRATAECLGEGLIKLFTTVRSYEVKRMKDGENTTFFAKPIFSR